MPGDSVFLKMSVESLQRLKELLWNLEAEKREHFWDTEEAKREIDLAVELLK